MRGRDRARLCGVAVFVAGCGPRYPVDTESGGAAAATSEGGGSTGATGSTGSGTTEAVTTSGTTGETTGGPVMGTWRGMLSLSEFVDCASGETWGVPGKIVVPEACQALAYPLYVEVLGVLHPPGEEGPWQLSTLEITEIVAGPCLEWSCEQGATGPSCGDWEEVCDVYIECDPWKQDCPDGEKCAPYWSGYSFFWNSAKCVPVMPGAAGTGEPCVAEESGTNGVDDCAKGHMCWDVDPQTGMGVCVAQCSGPYEAPVCPECTTCLIVHEILAVCMPDCDPLLQDCPDGQLCLQPPLYTTFHCFQDDSGAGGELFDACEVENACDAGLWCAPPEQASECDPQAAGCCLPFCDVLAPSCPGVGQVCAPWFEMAPACGKHKNVGICRLPP